MFAKVYNLYREIVKTTQVDQVNNYLPYGEYDAFPLKLAKLVQDSPSTSACISTLSDFIEGEGFNESDLEKFTVNDRGETLWDIHRSISESLATFEGFALCVKYNRLGTITNVYSVPFENCRLGKPDDTGFISKIHYNPFFGTDLFYQSKKDKDTKIYDTFNPDPEVVKEQIAKNGRKYLGQILYFGTTKALNRYYPQPSYYAAKYWMEVDARIGQYHQKNLANGFLQPILFKIIGDPNKPAGIIDEPDKTYGDIFNDTMEKDFAGTDRVGNIMAMWANTREEFPEIVPFPANNNGELFNTLQNQTTKNLTIATKVPAILANINEGVSLGGDGNTIRASVKLMQQRSLKWQKILCGTYTRLLANWNSPKHVDLSIIPYNPYPEVQNVDPAVWNEMTREERRKWIKDHTEIELNDDELVDNVQPTQTQAKYTNALHVNYPDKAKKNAKKALEYLEKTGIKCGGKGGKELSNRISNGEPLNFKEIKRLLSYLKKNESFSNSPLNESCDAILYQLWGGKEMRDWAEQKVNEVLQ